MSERLKEKEQAFKKAIEGLDYGRAVTIGSYTGALSSRLNELEEENERYKNEVDILLTRNKRMEAKTLSLIKQSKYYKRSLERMKRHYEIQLQAYGDRYMATYNFERYDEVRDFIHRIEEILEGFK